MRLGPYLIGSVMALIGSGVVLAAAASDQKPPAPPTAATPAAAPAAAAAAAPDDAVRYKALLNRYCVACHNNRNPTAGLAFNTLDLSKWEDNAPVLEKVTRKLRGRMMPPPGAPRPDEATTAGFVAWLEQHLDQTAAKAPDPGRISLHRLNRAEYANAVRDLFNLEVNAAALLPQDDTSDGFDNIAEVLKVSPVFMDQYISAARTVAIAATGDPKMKPLIVTLKPAPGLSQGEHLEGLPLGTRGGYVTDHVFPAEGDYAFTLQGSLTFAYDDEVRDDRLVAVVDGRLVYDSAKAPPEPPKKVPLGVARGHKFSFTTHITGGRHTIGAGYVATTYLANLNQLPPWRVQTGVTGPVLTNIQIDGPANPVSVGRSPSRDAVFICHPAGKAAEESCARKIIASIARRAYRRPLTEADMEPPLRFFRDGQKAGGFETGVQQALMAILVSPSFLYRTTAIPKGLTAGQAYAVSDMDLASRLSFFLWSSLPDEELIKAAEQHRLSQPKVLQAEVRRMLADPRAESLVTNFAFEWLHLNQLDTVDPDPNIFPEWDPGLRFAFKEEARLFMGDIFHGNGSVLRLLDGKDTFVNERLARHYGIPNVVGNSFRRVSLEDRNRWGLLGKGAVLTVTSYPNRTAPVLRGAWLLEVMGTPPTPPPPGVGALSENVDGQKAHTVRELMAIHRTQPSCNACHGVMDPIGLSLENFDAIGGWRAKDRFAGETIDASTVTVAGDKMNGVSDLRAQLLKRPDQFVDAFTEKLMIYGLGRSLSYRDMPTVRAVVRASAPSGYRFNDLVMGIVQSEQFRMSRVPLPPGPTQVAEGAGNKGGKR
jgi:mono/diheme cytochrome c family protein